MPKHPTHAPARLRYSDDGKTVACTVAQLVFVATVSIAVGAQMVGAIETVTETAV
jgi:hypothetical protein